MKIAHNDYNDNDEGEVKEGNDVVSMGTTTPESEPGGKIGRKNVLERERVVVAREEGMREMKGKEVKVGVFLFLFEDGGGGKGKMGNIRGEV